MSTAQRTVVSLRAIAPWRAAVWLSIIAAALALGAVEAWVTPGTPRQWAAAGALALAGVAQEEICRTVERTRRQIAGPLHATMTAVWLTACTLAGPVAALVPLALLLWIYVYLRSWTGIDRRDRALSLRAVHNGAIAGLSALAAYHTLHLLGGVEDFTTAALLVAAAAAAVNSVVNLVLVAAGLHVRRENRFVAVVRRPAEWMIIATGLALGTVCGVLLLHHSLPWALLTILPVVALHRASLARPLETAAATDARTGLVNSTAWRVLADRQLRRALDHRRPCAVIMVDLDHFKQVNDTWGHPAGDAVLAELARVLRSTVRADDVVGRLGGEEFAAWLPGCDPLTAMHVGERLRAAVQAMIVTTRSVTGEDVVIAHRTASCGVAITTSDGDTMDGLIEAADRRMYAAKTSGRNRVIGPVTPLHRDTAG